MRVIFPLRDPHIMLVTVYKSCHHLCTIYEPAMFQLNELWELHNLKLKFLSFLQNFVTTKISKGSWETIRSLETFQKIKEVETSHYTNTHLYSNFRDCGRSGHRKGDWKVGISK